MAKDKGGRPKIIDNIVLQKLEQAFTMDMTDLEACLYAGISAGTLYNYQKEKPEFLERKQMLKNSLSLKAKTNVAIKINKGDVQESKWWLERRRKKEFSPRVENTGADGEKLDFNVNVTISHVSKSKDD